MGKQSLKLMLNKHCLTDLTKLTSYIRINSSLINMLLFDARINCPVYSIKDLDFKWPSVTLHVLAP
jgi:hypothetical protein